MNERIKELAKEAGVLADYGEDIKEGRYSIGGSYQSMEKFAELFVRECISALEEKIYRSIDGEGDEVWADLILKEHFGVE